MRLADITLAAAMILAAGPALADPMVVRANGPSAARYVAGRKLPGNAKIVLLKGDQLILLDEKGVRTLSGPGTYMATGGPAVAAPSTLAVLASSATQRRARVGAVRQLPDGSTARPNIFFVDAAVPGRMCVADPASVEIWRAASETPASWTIVSADGTSAPLTWIKGQSAQAWPAGLTVRPGSTYRITGSAAAPVTIEFQLLDEPPSDMQTLASGLIAHRCSGQVDMLIATTAAK